MEKRQKFTPEFKREAVRQLRDSGKPAAVVARELGIPRNRIYKWASDLDQQGAAAFSGSTITRHPSNPHHPTRYSDSPYIPDCPYSP